MIRFLVTFNFDYASFFGVAQVIWVIGVSMVVMAALIYLPIGILGILGLAMIVFHNLLDRFSLPPPIAFGGSPDPLQAVWLVLHQQSLIPIGGSAAFVAYPLIPWIGVMAAGYALGAVYSWERERRRKWMLAIGVAATVLFIAVRFTNFYGDPAPWTNEAEFIAKASANGGDAPSGQEPNVVTPNVSEPAFSILSFLNTQKYPPSLLYLLMTLGPALIVLALTDGISGNALWQKIAIVFGRVPLFFYVLQWIVAHTIAIVASVIAGKPTDHLLGNIVLEPPAKPGAGFGLVTVYAMWALGVLLLYPLCKWYADLKARRRDWWLSYL